MIIFIVYNYGNKNSIYFLKRFFSEEMNIEDEKDEDLKNHGRNMEG